ncbi:hypothetical protein PENTCL1PPCAC_26288, partial [Pristionchus entomophagus]
ILQRLWKPAFRFAAFECAPQKHPSSPPSFAIRKTDLSNMSTPATWRDIQRSQKRREKIDKVRSDQLSQSTSRYSRNETSRYSSRSEPTWPQNNTGFMDFSSDTFAISNQVPVQQNYMMTNGPQYGQQPVMIAPQPQELIDYVISPTNIVLFHGRHFLSTLYKSPMLVEDFQYPSVEHYYQACKLYTLGGPEFAQRMNGVNEPTQCKSTVRNILNQINVPKSAIEGWKRSEAPEILIHANLYKFAQNRELREKLLSTGDALLVHTFDKDDLYAIGMNEETTKKWSLDNNGKHVLVPRYFLKEYFVQTNKLPTYHGKGKNLLGVILMMIREVFRPERGRFDPKIMDLLNNMRGPRF